MYNQKIDPTNQMPAVANQQPSANQAVVLPVERESSSIPKGGTDSTWLYPSPQMVGLILSILLNQGNFFCIVLECIGEKG